MTEIADRVPGGNTQEEGMKLLEGQNDDVVDTNAVTVHSGVAAVGAGDNLGGVHSQD